MKYVVTGISRLTGEREAISRPKEYMVAYGMLLRAQKKYGSATARHRAYTCLKLQEAVEEGRLWRCILHAGERQVSLPTGYHKR